MSESLTSGLEAREIGGGFRDGSKKPSESSRDGGLELESDGSVMAVTLDSVVRRFGSKANSLGLGDGGSLAEEWYIAELDTLDVI